MKVGEAFILRSSDNRLDSPRKSITDPDSFLPMDRYEAYYTAIVSDHVHAVDEALSTCSPREKDRMLNGHFVYETIAKASGHKHEIRKNVDVYRPLGVATAAASVSVLQYLIDNHADVMYTENDDNNVMHVLILTSEVYPEMEDRFLAAYRLLCKKIPRDDLVQLLLAENQSGIRPVELAAERGSYQILEAIFETRGVYLTKIQNVGVTSYHWYDVTEYETTEEAIGKRRMLCPLNMYVKLLQ